VRDKNIVVGVLAVPAGAAQKVADDLVDAGVRIIFNYSEGAARRAERCHRAHVEPRRGTAARPVLPPRLRLMNLVLAAGGTKFTS
jgi:hypothetical protein